MADSGRKSDQPSPKKRLTDDQGESNFDVRACVVCSHTIFRSSLVGMLARHNIGVCGAFDDQEQLAAALGPDGALECHAILLVTPADTPFSTFYQIHRVLDQTARRIPIVVLAEHLTRGQIHTSLNTGARAFLDFQAEPDELARAIRVAAAGRVYLPPEAIEQLLETIPGLVEHEDSTHAHLSPREKQILSLLCDGVHDKQAAVQLHLSVKTIKNHRSAIYRKCGVHNVAQLVRHAIREGFISV